MCVVRLVPQPRPGSGFKVLHLEAPPAPRCFARLPVLNFQPVTDLAGALWLLDSYPPRIVATPRFLSVPFAAALPILLPLPFALPQPSFRDRRVRLVGI